MRKRTSAEDREQIVRRYTAGESSEVIGTSLGFSGVTVRNVLKKAGVPIRGPSESHRIFSHDASAFDRPWNNEKAYWIGAMLSDGYLCRDPEGGSPSVNLAANDKDWIVSFKEFLKAGHSIGERKREGRYVHYRISIKCQRLADALHEAGISYRKSGTVEPPKELCTNPHFWRGVIDGDGEVDDGNNCPTVNLTGSFSTIQAFCTFASSLLPEYEPYVKRAMHRASTHHVDYHGEGAKVLLQALYGIPGPAMRRKKEKALLLLEKYRRKKFRIIRGRTLSTSFPYSYRDGKKAEEDFRKLRDADLASLHSPLFGRKTGSLLAEGILAKTRIGYYASGYFGERLRMTASYKGALSPLEAWETHKDKILAETASRKHSGVKSALYANCRAVFGFPPLIMRWMIEHFGWERVLDPCAGWGDRLVGACASPCNEYWGVDPHTDAHTVYTGMKSAYGNGKEIRLLCSPFEDADLPSDYFDGVFTSPPYFDLESYSQDPGQSSLRYPQFEEWKEGFLGPLIEKSAASLRKGGVLAINIADIRNGPPVTKALHDQAAESGLHFGGFLALSTGNFGREHEPIWIWHKV